MTLSGNLKETKTLKTPLALLAMKKMILQSWCCFDILLNISAESLSVKQPHCHISMIHSASCSQRSGSSTIKGLGQETIPKFSRLNMSDEAECGWRSSRIVASFPCPSCETKLRGGAAAFLWTISIQAVWVYFWEQLLCSTHACFPRSVWWHLFSHRSICPGSSLFVM